MVRTRIRSPSAIQWIRQWPRRHQDQVLELAEMVLGVDRRIAEAVKWKRLTYAVDGHWHDWICGIAVTHKGARLVLHKGTVLADPLRVLAGSGRYVRDVPYEVAVAHPEAIGALIESAIDHEADTVADG